MAYPWAGAEDKKQLFQKDLNVQTGVSTPVCTRRFERQGEAGSGKRRGPGQGSRADTVLVTAQCSVLQDTWAFSIGAWPSRSFSTVLLKAKCASRVPGSLVKM